MTLCVTMSRPFIVGLFIMLEAGIIVAGGESVEQQQARLLEKQTAPASDERSERPTSENSRALADFLGRFPEADADGDGILTEAEHGFHRSLPSLGKYGTNSVHRHVDIPMRDGHTVPAEVYLPATEEGPWPVLLTRAGYDRWHDWNVPVDGANQGIVYVIHDTRRWEGGRHANWQDPETSLNELEDGYDVVEWIAAQPWCNGRIGTVGGSGHGYASAMMIWADIPHYTVCGIGNTAGDVKHYWYYHNGVRRGVSYSWIGSRGVSAPLLPAPTLPHVPYDYDGWLDFIRGRGRDVQTWYFNDTGWFDPLSEGALDSFAALQHTGRAFVRVEPRCHGGIKGLPGGLTRFPVRGNRPEPVQPPSTLEILKGAEPAEGLLSTLTYFLMGDVLDDTAPGNHYMTTHEWPVPHEKVTFYLHANGSLDRTAPTGEGESLTYTYDPRNPAPTLGGHHDWVHASGPFDQRPLRERDDVLYFVTEPLSEPFGLTGKIRMRLFFSSDAEDTAFVVKLVDIYPDGYEFIVRESAGMGRYHSGYQSPSPLKQGEVYELDLDLWSSAIVFNTRHRIGLIVTSSSETSYQVHPNTYDPVTSYAETPVARNTLHCSTEHQTRLILPKVPVP